MGFLSIGFTGSWIVESGLFVHSDVEEHVASGDVPEETERETDKQKNREKQKTERQRARDDCW